MAYAFNPYLMLPGDSRRNPYFISTSAGGLSHCIVRGSNGYTLPNCVALVHAEWLKILADALGEKKAAEYESLMCRNNAAVYYGYISDGFSRGQTPKLGAIACWKGGSSGAGHVALVTAVEGLNWSGVASNYSGSAFYSCSYAYKGSVTKYNLGSSYTFQGFIYPPVEFSLYAVQSVPRDPKTAQVRVKIDNLNVRQGPTTGAVRLGYAEPGYYNVRQVSTGDTYVWYEIEPAKWVANPKNGGTWLEYLPAESPVLYEVTFKVSAGDVAGLQEYGKKIQVTPTVKRL